MFTATNIKNSMLRKLKIMMLIFVIIIVSCKKNIPEINHLLTIGVLNTTILYHDCVPDTVITSWEIVSNYPIDIDGDNSNDFNFSVLNQYMFGGMSLLNSELRIETLNANSFVMADSIYPKVFSYGDVISLNDDWENGNLLLLHSSEECCPPTGNSFHEGYWLKKNENYIAIKQNERLGWIKIGIEAYTSVKIFDYALMK